MKTSKASTNCSFREQKLRIRGFSSGNPLRSVAGIRILSQFFLGSGAILGFVLVNFNLQSGGAPFLRHHRCYETSRPQQMATRTVLRPNQTSEACHSGIPLTFLAYLQRQLRQPPSDWFSPAPTLASLAKGPWWKFVISGMPRPFQGKGATSLRCGSRWAQTCVYTHGHTPLYPFICLQALPHSPLKIASILPGSSFSAKTEGLRGRKAKGFPASFFKKKRQLEARPLISGLRSKQVQGHLQIHSKYGASLGYMRKKKQRKENGSLFIYLYSILLS